jgi:NADPH2 dehydrogenase
MSSSKLFQSIKVGDIQLSHRAVLAPLTRYRANDAHVPSPLAKEYYIQRASTPGTLLIAEAAFIAPQAGGYPNVPGIYTDDQITAWKEITDAVHAKGSFMYLQLWALGRTANPAQLRKEDPSYKYVSSYGTKHPDESEIPHALTEPEIRDFIGYYASAAVNAVHRAGFDGVEIHGASGYLIDQFTQDVVNKRTDGWGGGIEGRARFALEVVNAVTKAVGDTKVGIRMSPWGTFNGMRMADPLPTFAYLVAKLREAHPNLAYLHVVEPRADGGVTLAALLHQEDSNDFIRAIWGDRRLISAGGYSRAQAIEVADAKGDLIAFGRHYIANPDLPYRLLKNIPFTAGDRSTYYGYGSLDPKGYTDYPFAQEIEKAESRL